MDFPFQREYSSVFRYAYERTSEGKTQKEIRGLAKQIWCNPASNNQQALNSWIVQCAILNAQAQYAAHQSQITTGLRPNKPVVWGGRKQLSLRRANKITHAEWQRARLRPLCLQGEVLQKSNRLFDFSLLHKSLLIYKPNKTIRLTIPLTGYGPKQLHQLMYIQSQIGKIPVQVQLKQGQVCLTYEQEKSSVQHNAVPNRILGIDQNPNSVGVTIMDFRDGKSRVVYAEQIQWNKAARTDSNKRDHETTQIAHAIAKLARHYRVSEVALENLTMGARDAGKGRNFNRLVNNEWNRTQFDWCIRKLCDKYSIPVFHANCAYSSTIGNLTYRNLPDACGAAAEIARRAHHKYKKKLCMYPPLVHEELELLTQWKNEGFDFFKITTWQALHNLIKNAELKYRVQLSSLRSAVSRFFSTKSGLLVYTQFAVLR